MSFAGEWMTHNYDLVNRGIEGPVHMSVKAIEHGFRGTWGQPKDPARSEMTGTVHCDGRVWEGTWVTLTHKGSFLFVLGADEKTIHGAWCIGDEGMPQPWWGIRCR